VPPADVARGSAARGVDEGLPSTRIFGGASVLTLELTSLASRPVEYCAATPVVSGHSSITTRRSAHPQNCSEERTGGVQSQRLARGWRRALTSASLSCPGVVVIASTRNFETETSQTDTQLRGSIATTRPSAVPHHTFWPISTMHVICAAPGWASDAAGRAAGRRAGPAHREARGEGAALRPQPRAPHLRLEALALEGDPDGVPAPPAPRTISAAVAIGAMLGRRGRGRARFGDIAHAAHLPRPEGGHLRALRARRRVLQPLPRRPLQARVGSERFQGGAGAGRGGLPCAAGPGSWPGGSRC